MDTNTSYLTLVSSGEFELEVKKSRFIVRYCPVASRDDALNFIASWREAYPDARHHCWAYCVGQSENPTTVAMSDDGEPSGTAGKPILNAILGKAIGNICVVVIRYFGGTKLGAGGLIRAYGGSVSKALDLADTIRVKPKLKCDIICDFAFEQKMRHWLSIHGGEALEVSYSNQVTMLVSIDIDQENELHALASAYGLDVSPRL